MNYGIIKFDDAYFANYYGLERLELPSGWTDTYNNLVLDNSLNNVSSGYIFLNTITHFFQDWSKVNTLGLPNTTFWENMINKLKYGSRFANTWTNFCGFFQIKTSYDSYNERNVYRLWFSNFSYANSIKLPPDKRFKLLSNQIISTEDGFLHFPRSIIHISEQSNELIQQYLYFPVSDFMETIENTESEYLKADVIFSNGEQVEISEDSNKTNDTESLHEDSNEYLKDSDAVIISALVNALELENPDNFSGNDKLVVNHLQKLHPGQPYLTKSTISKRLAIGRKILGISKK